MVPTPATPLRGNGHLALVPGTAEVPDAPALESESWAPRPERSRRAERAERAEQREHAPFLPGVRGDVGPLIEALHEIFERDRAIASQGSSTRCGICYLHFSRADLAYREAEGFYACPSCAQALGSAALNMIRRQQI